MPVLPRLPSRCALYSGGGGLIVQNAKFTSIKMHREHGSGVRVLSAGEFVPPQRLQWWC